MDSEQARYRELFELLEKEANEAKKAKAPRRSGRVGNGIVSASCAAVLAVYATGYARTQSAADRFARELHGRRVTAQPLPGVSVALNRKDVSHPEVAVDPTPTPESGHHFVSTAKPLHTPPAEPAPGPAEPLTLTSPTPVPAFAPAPEIDRSVPVPKPEPTPTAVVAPSASWKDGTYTGWGYSRHGNIEAQVIVEGGRIASATISQCRTRYSCSVIDQLPPQVAQRQSPEVDYVSGATQSADAFYGAVVEALGKAK